MIRRRVPLAPPVPINIAFDCHAKYGLTGIVGGARYLVCIVVMLR